MNRFQTLRLLAAVSAVFMAPGLYAGECPASMRGANPQVKAPDHSHNIQVQELASLDLGKEAPKLDGRRLRVRTITFQPGGYVPIHSHDDRPALAMVTKGQLVEYKNGCKIAIQHKLGSIVKENRGVTHWVINRTDSPAVLTVSDIPDDRIKNSRFK